MERRARNRDAAPRAGLPVFHRSGDCGTRSPRWARLGLALGTDGHRVASYYAVGQRLGNGGCPRGGVHSRASLRDQRTPPPVAHAGVPVKPSLPTMFSAGLLLFLAMVLAAC